MDILSFCLFIHYYLETHTSELLDVITSIERGGRERLNSYEVKQYLANNYNCEKHPSFKFTCYQNYILLL